MYVAGVWVAGWMCACVCVAGVLMTNVSRINDKDGVLCPIVVRRLLIVGLTSCRSSRCGTRTAAITLS